MTIRSLKFCLLNFNLPFRMSTRSCLSMPWWPLTMTQPTCHSPLPKLSMPSLDDRNEMNLSSKTPQVGDGPPRIFNIYSMRFPDLGWTTTPSSRETVLLTMRHNYHAPSLVKIWTLPSFLVMRPTLKWKKKPEWINILSKSCYSSTFQQLLDDV